MNKKLLIAALAAIAFLAPVTMSHAQSLKQVGKNIGRETTRAGKNIGKESKRVYKNGEYGVRKGGENASVTTHRAIGNNSKVRNRGKKKTDVVTPTGKHYPVKKG